MVSRCEEAQKVSQEQIMRQLEEDVNDETKKI